MLGEVGQAMSVSSDINPTGKDCGCPHLLSKLAPDEKSNGGGSGGGKLGGMLHGGGMSDSSNSACPEDALCVIDVNFTTKIETSGSFMTLGH